ncbi:hypothetical protein VQ02_10185 [Methylobacterium variabile]|jgi:hypothetical protein|uniref:Uncharacterized protein n=1 Tax=Methylobacterium variabile TaxID=298794 RepID=A0A0J6SVI8_9HYPH|nr:hypothetical protein [Methylobacterium variabile]KMO39300.1 hypothetical protein VQ02_10185 [Methylobacterium variabile]
MKKPHRADLYLPRERLPAMSFDDAGDAACGKPVSGRIPETLDGGCRLYRPDFRQQARGETARGDHP